MPLTRYGRMMMIGIMIMLKQMKKKTLKNIILSKYVVHGHLLYDYYLSDFFELQLMHAGTILKISVW